MKKRIILLTISICLFLASVSCDSTESNIFIIKSGTSFGHCAGYCITEMTIDSRTIQFSERGWNPVTAPEKTTELSISRDQYTDLCSLCSLNSFQELEETIGCPDCYDQGSEWIEITTADFTKRVTFSFGEKIKAIEALQTKIREIRMQFVD